MAVNMDDETQLLFFDTFSHETSEELNLDLVQFPKPVLLSEVRIIPLGARVQADFPGGVRLGATNPSQFTIEFFVNDLSKPGAATFESLGSLDYKQNGNIQLPFDKKSISIPTDGLVLRGLYTTITLAVYGCVSKSLTENANASSSAHAASAQNVETESRSPRPEWASNDSGNSQRFKDSQDQYQRNYSQDNRQYPQQEYGGNFGDQWKQSQQNPGDGYEKEQWDGQRGGNDRWERGEGGPARHGASRGGWEWNESRINDYHDRQEWSGSRGASRRSWDESNARKRPHTPPMDEKKWTKSNEKPPAEVEAKGISKLKRRYSAGANCLLSGTDTFRALLFLLALLGRRL